MFLTNKVYSCWSELFEIELFLPIKQISKSYIGIKLYSVLQIDYVGFSDQLLYPEDWNE